MLEIKYIVIITIFGTIILVYLVLLFIAQCIVRPLRYANERKRVLPPSVKSLRTPVHCSHRGGCMFGPENTIYTYRKCVNETRTDVLEFDLHLTKDKKIVLCHNLTVDATTNGTGYIANMTLDEIKQLDAAYWYTLDHGHTYPLRGKGITMPTLEEVLEEFRDDNNLNLFFDFKAIAPIPYAINIVAEKNLQNRIFVGAVFPSVNEAMMKQIPRGIPTTDSLSVSLKVLLSYHIGLFPLITLEHDIIGFFIGPPTYWMITDGLLKEIIRRNRLVGLFGPYLSDENILRKFIKLGSVFLVTDRPDLLRRLLDDNSAFLENSSLLNK